MPSVQNRLNKTEIGHKREMNVETNAQKQTFFVFVAVIEFHRIFNFGICICILNTGYHLPNTETHTLIQQECLITKIKLFEANLKLDTFGCQKQTNYNANRLIVVLMNNAEMNTSIASVLPMKWRHFFFNRFLRRFFLFENWTKMSLNLSTFSTFSLEKKNSSNVDISNERFPNRFIYIFLLVIFDWNVYSVFETNYSLN